MQIHEITIKKKSKLDEVTWGEDPITDLGQAAGKTVSGIKNVGSAIAAPFKDVAQGYTSARQDQKVSAVADKAFRAWQKYVSQLEQSIAVQPAPATTPAKTASAATTPADTAPATTPAKTASAATTPADTAPAKPNYGAQTGAGANVTYKQSTSIPNPNAPQPTNTVGPKTPGVTVSTPATVASTAPGQTITVGGQKIKPGDPLYAKLANAPVKAEGILKELQASAGAVSPALAAFRDRTDGKYESYLTAFVQKNLLAGMGFKGLVNQQEITNAIKAIAAPANADPATQRPLWNDLARACALAVPAAGALTGRAPGATKDSNAPGATPPDTTTPGKEPVAGEEPSAEEPAQAEPAKPGMTKAQISQWISRNSEDHATLKAALDAINAIKG